MNSKERAQLINRLTAIVESDVVVPGKRKGFHAKDQDVSTLKRSLSRLHEGERREQELLKLLDKFEEAEKLPKIHDPITISSRRPTSDDVAFLSLLSGFAIQVTLEVNGGEQLTTFGGKPLIVVPREHLDAVKASPVFNHASFQENLGRELIEFVDDPVEFCEDLWGALSVSPSVPATSRYATWKLIASRWEADEKQLNHWLAIEDGREHRDPDHAARVAWLRERIAALEPEAAE